jgi:hypothetical protein
MPADNRFWFDDDQDLAPCRPKPTEQNPKCSILDSQPRVMMFSIEDAQLLTKGKDLEAQVVSGTEKGT